jgi:hypothetical protein
VNSHPALGSRNLLPIDEALFAVGLWYVEPSPERGGLIEKALNDSFDCDAEDRWQR